MSFIGYRVAEVDYSTARDFFREHHYTASLPASCSSGCYGLFLEDLLVGAVAFGPTTYPSGMKSVLELRRLALVDGLVKNTASWFVSRCLRMLPKVDAVISYADPAQGHLGAVYRALNFVPYGQTAPSYHYERSDGTAVHKRVPWGYAKRHGLLTDRGTVDEMQAAVLLGLSRVPDPPKIRFLRPLSADLKAVPCAPVPQYGYVYALMDPDTLAVRYIGKTEVTLAQRLAQHISRSGKDKTHKSAWIRSLLSQEKRPLIRAIEIRQVDELDQAEKAWIALLEEQGFDLCNATDGGPGVAGARSPLTTLRAEWVEDIRNRAATQTYASIATEYGISVPSVCDIVKGRSWLSAGGPLSTTRKPHGLKGHQHTEQAKASYRTSARRRAESAEWRAKMSRVAQGRSGLTEEKVVWLRDTYRDGGVTCAQLAKEIGVGVGTAHRAIVGDTWTQVNTPPVPRPGRGGARVKRSAA